MYSKNRLIKVGPQETEERCWKKLNHLCKELKFLHKQTETKFFVEQKLENYEKKGKVRFNKVVEVLEFEKNLHLKLSKLGELASIALDLKKDCGMIETTLKPSSNRYKKLDEKVETLKNYGSILEGMEREAECIRPKSQFLQSIKVKNLTQALSLASYLKRCKTNTAAFKPKLLRKRILLDNLW